MGFLDDVIKVVAPWASEEGRDDVLGLQPAKKVRSVTGKSVGPTDAEVLAADERLRRSLLAQKGRSAAVGVGTLGEGGVRLAMPSLVGVGGK